MKRLIVGILLLNLVLSCKPSALNYNDLLIGSQTRIATCIDSIFSENNSVNDIRRLRINIVQYAKNGLAESMNLKGFKNNNQFKEAALDYYSFANSFFSDDYLDSTLYLLNSTQRIEKLDSNRLILIQKDLNNFLKKEENLLKSQKEFAKEFKLKLAE